MGAAMAVPMPRAFEVKAWEGLKPPLVDPSTVASLSPRAPPALSISLPTQTLTIRTSCSGELLTADEPRHPSKRGDHRWMRLDASYLTAEGIDPGSFESSLLPRSLLGSGEHLRPIPATVDLPECRRQATRV